MDSSREPRMNRPNEQCGEEEDGEFDRVVAEIRRRVDQQSRGQVISSLFGDEEKDGSETILPSG